MVATAPGVDAQQAGRRVLALHDLHLLGAPLVLPLPDGEVRAALGEHDGTAAQVLKGLDALGVALLDHDGSAGVEVVDEVDGRPALLGVAHGGHDHIPPARLQAGDQSVEGRVGHRGLQAELGGDRGGEVGVDADELLGALLVHLHGRVALGGRHPELTRLAHGLGDQIPGGLAGRRGGALGRLGLRGRAPAATGERRDDQRGSNDRIQPLCHLNSPFVNS